MEEIVSDDPKQVSDQSPKVNSDDMVKYETHHKLLGQHKKLRDSNSDLTARLAKYEQADSDRQESQLAEEGRFKEAIEIKTVKINELLDVLDASKEREATTWKLQAFYSKLPGQLKREEFLSHAQIDKIIYDPDSMSCDSDSVEAVVNNFMNDYSDLVIQAQKGKLPSASPNSNLDLQGKITNRNVTPREGVLNGVTRLLGNN